MKVKDVQPRHSSDVTEAVIKAWKETHKRGVWEISVPTDEKDGEPVEEKDDKGRKKEVQKYVMLKGYFRKPTRQEMSASLTIKNDPIGQAEELMRDAWLGGDEELLDDDDYFQAAFIEFQELMTFKTGELKKL